MWKDKTWKKKKEKVTTLMCVCVCVELRHKGSPKRLTEDSQKYSQLSLYRSLLITNKETFKGLQFPKISISV